MPLDHILSHFQLPCSAPAGSPVLSSWIDLIKLCPALCCCNSLVMLQGRWQVHAQQSQQRQQRQEWQHTQGPAPRGRLCQLVPALSSRLQLPLQACCLPAKGLLGPQVTLKGIPLRLALIIACSRVGQGGAAAVVTVKRFAGLSLCIPGGTPAWSKDGGSAAGLALPARPATRPACCAHR